MSSFPSIVRACIDEAMARAPRMIERAAEHSAAALEDDLRRRGSTAERQEISHALREMHVLSVSWSARFPKAWRAACEGAGVQAPGARLNPSSLTLVDDVEIARTIESARLAMQLATSVDQSLAELDALMTPALGLEGVQPEENPLRPELLAQALRDVLSQDAPAGWPALWMRHMAAPLAEDLDALYRHCTKLLVKARVQVAGYRITNPAPLAPRASDMAPLERRAGPGGFQPQPSQQQPQGAPLPSGFMGLAVRALRGTFLADFLSNGGGAAAQQPLAPAYYAQVDQEMAQLEAAWDEAPFEPGEALAYQAVPVVDRPVREIGTDKPLTRDAWGTYSIPRQRSLVRTRLKQQATNAGQAIGIDLVRELLDQVARDPRLLAPVREAMVALEPALARLAMQSPQFFGEQDNPARRLLEGVAQRSFRYNDEFATEFQAFFEPVRLVFNALNRIDDLEDARPFEAGLNRLQEGWNRQDAAEEQQRQQVLEAVKVAEQRQAEAERIAWELSQRTDLEGTPAPVQDFLYERWTLVLAEARSRAKPGEMDPGGYTGVIADLLWSVKPKETLRDPARAFELIPRVVMRLRTGLDLIGAQADENDTFFRALERLHRPVLKLRARHRRQAFGDPSELPAGPDLQPAPRQKPQQAEDVWLAPQEQQAFGFQDTVFSKHALEAAEAEEAARAQPPAPEVTPAAVEQVIGSLHTGCWVDLYSRNRWRRAQLHWASARGTLFMFLSHGGRPHSMTRRSLQRLVAERHLRPLESHEVVQHAIEVLERTEPEAMAA